MYCVRCGVALGPSEKSCPLCQTVAYHPDMPQQTGPGLYPKGRLPATGGRSLLIPGVLTLLCLLSALIAGLCDQQINGGITWSGYVLGALGTGLIAIVLPSWFRRPNPAIFVPCGFAAVLLYLLYICLTTGGRWFLPFALPVCGGIGLIVTATATLLRYLRRGRLYVAGGAFVALGGFMLLIEFQMLRAFAISRFSGWSVYALSVLCLVGLLLIFLAICSPARRLMERKFFI